MNPWGLTPRQCVLMDALCEHGLLKLAAHSLGMNEHTAKGHLKYIRAAMRERSLVLICLQWAEWRKKQRLELRLAA